jgi:hypothetical protein
MALLIEASLIDDAKGTPVVAFDMDALDALREQGDDVAIALVIQTFPISKPFSGCTVNQQHNPQKVWILFVIFAVGNISFNFKLIYYG